MPNKIMLSLEAESDIDESYLWYELRKKGLGINFINAISNAFHAINNNPDSWPMSDYGLKKFVIRKFPFVIYYLYYKEAKEIKVIAILHSSRNPNSLIKRIDDSQ